MGQDLTKIDQYFEISLKYKKELLIQAISKNLDRYLIDEISSEIIMTSIKLKDNLSRLIK